MPGMNRPVQKWYEVNVWRYDSELGWCEGVVDVLAYDMTGAQADVQSRCRGGATVTGVHFRGTPEEYLEFRQRQEAALEKAEEDFRGGNLGL